MYRIICNNDPLSQNARTSFLIRKYRRYLKRQFESVYPKSVGKYSKNVNLYGIVYYFHKRKIRKDADNISKPLWDALETVFYDNDNVIKYRQAGTLFIKSTGTSRIDLTTISSKTIRDKIIDFTVNASNKENHMQYVELGKIRKDIYKFELE